MGKLVEIQAELKAPKNQRNSFGGYNYRSCEDILEAVKPLLLKHNAELYLTDKVECVGNRYYVVATARFKCGDEVVEVSAAAREPEARKGMDESQITGSASSYARKYALNGLFLIDDTKDADTDELRNERSARAKQASASFTKEQLEEMKKWNDGTFTADELAKFKASIKDGDFGTKFDSMRKEFEKRKAGTPSAKEEKGASDAFDIY